MDVFVNHYNRLFQIFADLSKSLELFKIVDQKKFMKRKNDLQMRFTEQANLWREIYGDVNFICAM